MIPPLNCVRYLGRPEFDTSVARIVVDSLNAHLGTDRRAGSVSAGYKLMSEYMTRFTKIMYREADTALQAETVAAMSKHWIARGWGADLMADPVSGAPFLWKVSEKAFDYQNRDGVLPGAESPAGDGTFPEYRPYGSIPGTMRLFKGKTMWWVTNNGTHGSTSDCRQSKWWVWPTALCQWCVWKIAGTTRQAGAGKTGTIVGRPSDVELEMTAHEKKVMSLIIANFDNDMADEHFTSKKLWHDAEVMLS